MSITNTRRGEVTRWSRTLIPTSREAPADAEMPSHILLVRAGFIRKLVAGVYDYLPLAHRTIRKISDIVREEMHGAGAAEFLMPAMEPVDLLRETGRAEDYGDDLFTLEDRHGRLIALAPTHEEPIVELTRASITSYRQLPLGLFQIQTKFRDEPRPRSGLLRGREFIMKDAYTFHTHLEGPGGLDEAYDAMYRAYSNTFARCGLSFTAVEAESGPIGGSASHEFMVNCESGEDKVLVCPVSGYAANVEKAEIGARAHDLGAAPTGDLETVHTPDLPDIESVGKAMKVKPKNMLKCVLFQPIEDTPRFVLAVVRGDHDVNEGKVRDAVGPKVRLAPDEDARGAGFAIGYVSPRSILGKGILLVDPDAAQGGFWATGADEKDHHVKHFNWTRDLGAGLTEAKVVDLRNAEEGDPSPRAEGATLQVQRGIEVGHIFKLGTKYSDAMGFQVMDEDQKRQSVIMGCYGIGITRTMAACVEMSHDADGIIWPAAIAPYHVLITLMKPDEHMAIAEDLAAKLAQQGADVLIDDREERPGVKFKDADLIGLPLRLTIGDKALEQGGVELKVRGAEGKGDLVKMDEVVTRCMSVLNG
ncbi:MAG: proline--tRNA ligase, partial [Phycisphaerales bacterium]|nr:proline--tRNA ligase [Phycisphaerales bacterium]